MPYYIVHSGCGCACVCVVCDSTPAAVTHTNKDHALLPLPLPFSLLSLSSLLRYVPVGSIIDVKDYVDEGTGKVDVDALAKYLRYLAGNDTAYAEYTRWRDEPLPANIATLQKLGRDSAPCRICHCLRGRLGCDDVL